MKWSLSVVLCATITLGAAAQDVPADHSLDVAAQPTTPHSPDRPFLPRPLEEIVSLTDQPPSKSRLSVRLLSNERASSRWGEQIVYEVLVQNTGASTVLFPWSSDANAFKQADQKHIPRGYRRASLTVEVQNAEHVVLGHLEGISLYGSDEVEGSLLALAPGKTARITIPGRWATFDDDARRRIEQESSKGPVFWVAGLTLPAERISIQSVNRLRFSAQ